MLKRILSPIHEFGVIAGLLYLVDSILRRISPRFRLFFYEFMVQPIPDKALIPPGLAKNLKIREVLVNDPEINEMPVPPEVISSRFAQGATCLGIFKNEKFMGYMWLSFKAYNEDEVRCTFLLTPEDESVFDFDFYIFPEYRMGLAFVGLWNGANEYLRHMGVKQSYSRLSRFNIESRKSHKHFGWKCLGRAIFVQIWGAELMLCTMSPYFNFSARKSGRVRLKLRPDVLINASSPAKK